MGKYSLIMVLGFVLIFGIMKSKVLEQNRRAEDNFVDCYVRTMVNNISNSFNNIALRKLADDYEWRAGFSNAPFAGGFCSTFLEDSDDDSTLGRTEIRITSTATYSDLSKTTVVVVEKSSFAKYAYFTNIEPLIYFVTEDTIRGPLHTNDQFNIAGDPVFFGLISSVSSTWAGWGDPQFLGGTDFGRARIDLPIDLTELINSALDGGAVVNTGPPRNRDLWLDFQADGTVKAGFSNSGRPSTWVTRDLSTINGVIGVYGGYDVHIEGTLNGQITLGCTKNIYIEDDIKYAVDPRIDPFSDDILGLVAKKEVIVADNIPNSNDCEIHASIMALGDSFTVENYAWGSPRGTLTVLGGIIQKIRGAVGTFDSGGIITGYNKNYIYDGRLLTRSPPSYPIFNEISIVSWWE